MHNKNKWYEFNYICSNLYFWPKLQSSNCKTKYTALKQGDAKLTQHLSLQMLSNMTWVNKGSTVIDNLLNFHFAAAGTSTGGNASSFHALSASSALKCNLMPVWVCSRDKKLSPKTISGKCVVWSPSSKLKKNRVGITEINISFLRQQYSSIDSKTFRTLKAVQM